MFLENLEKNHRWYDLWNLCIPSKKTNNNKGKIIPMRGRRLIW